MIKKNGLIGNDLNNDLNNELENDLKSIIINRPQLIFLFYHKMSNKWIKEQIKKKIEKPTADE